MPYLALYRKFRPRTFSDVKGQDHIVTTLKNQIKSDRIGLSFHGYEGDRKDHGGKDPREGREL